MTCREMYDVFWKEMLYDAEARMRAVEEFTNNYTSDKLYLCEVGDDVFQVAMIAWDDPLSRHCRNRRNWLLNGDTKRKLDKLSAKGVEVLLVHFVSNARVGGLYEAADDLPIVFAWRYDGEVVKAMGARSGVPRGQVAWNCDMDKMLGGSLRVDAVRLDPLPWEVATR